MKGVRTLLKWDPQGGGVREGRHGWRDCWKFGAITREGELTQKWKIKKEKRKHSAKALLSVALCGNSANKEFSDIDKLPPASATVTQ